MKRYILIPVFTGILNLTVYSQPSQLKVGDKIPNVSMGKMLDGLEKKKKFHDIKARLVILDFWNVHCTTCIRDMPKMDSIEKKYKGQVKIFAITKNNEKEVNNLFGRIAIKRPSFPFIVQDSIFNSLFPHNGDPLHVWVNEKNVITAITYDYNTNFENIDKFLTGTDLHLSRRWDFGVNEKFNLVSEQNAGVLDLASSYSALFRGLDEYATTSFIKIHDNLVQLTNATPLLMYSVAYDSLLYGFQVNQFRLTNDKRILIELKNKDPFVIPNDSEIAGWIKRNQVSYELKVPNDLKEMKFFYMREDLKRYFSYKVKIEKRKMKCLALIKTTDNQYLREKDTLSPKFIRSDSAYSLAINNLPISSFVAELTYSNPGIDIPIINETNILYNINLSIKSKLSDTAAVAKELRYYGLDLVEKEKNIDMLIIEDN